MTIRVYYDGSTYSMQSRGGINRYFSLLMQSLGDRVSGLLSYTVPLHSEIPASQNYRGVSVHRFGFWPGRLSYFFEGRYFRARRWAFKPDLIHPTYYELLTQETELSRSTPVVATIFDLIHERFPLATDPDGHIRRSKKTLINRADAIITLSTHTAENLIEHFGVPPSRIHMIYPGIPFPSPVREEAPSRGPTPSEVVSTPFVLFVGNRWIYKNFPTFLRAVAYARTRMPELKAVVVGPAFSQEELALITTLHLNQAINWRGYASDSELRGLYRSATALIYPSSYEGFGFPVVEAQAHGCPVITSPVSSLPEVGGDGALYAMPSDTEEIGEHIVRISNDSDLREHTISNGLANIKRFSWERCADEVHGLYRAVTSRNQDSEPGARIE